MLKVILSKDQAHDCMGEFRRGVVEEAAPQPCKWLKDSDLPPTIKQCFSVWVPYLQPLGGLGDHHDDHVILLDGQGSGALEDK